MHGDQVVSDVFMDMYSTCTCNLFDLMNDHLGLKRCYKKASNFFSFTLGVGPKCISDLASNTVLSIQGRNVSI